MAAIKSLTTNQEPYSSPILSAEFSYRLTRNETSPSDMPHADMNFS